MENKKDEQLTLEDLMKINLYNRKMSLRIISGLIFIMVSILNFAYVVALQNTTLSTQYALYRYIAAIENGHIDRDTEDSIKSRLIAALY